MLSLIQNIQYMAGIVLKMELMDDSVVQLILKKQGEFKVEKRRCVSLLATINRLLKEGYQAEIAQIKQQNEGRKKG